MRKASLSVFQCFYLKGFWKDVCFVFMALYYLYGLFPAIKDHGSNCNSMYEQIAQIDLDT